MLAILTSHPIQYQVPIWRALATSGAVPFEVWYLTDHGIRPSGDVEFGRQFAWDLDLLSGYPHRFLKVNDGWNLRKFRGVQLQENLAERIRSANVNALWIEGWRFSAFWTAVGSARRAGARVWMRAESNDLKRDPLWKGLLKRTILRRHLGRVDRFLCIGAANRRLYKSYGVPDSRMAQAPYCVDNDRFAQQAAVLRRTRDQIRARWNIPSDAFCFLFSGKFIAKKRPFDVVRAAQALQQNARSGRPVHLLFAGSGELGRQLRSNCRVVFDSDGPTTASECPSATPSASFAGFMNQTEIPAAYAAADALVLPSDCGETWGLVVNEAMACGVPAVVSDQCGCAEDLPARIDQRLVFRCANVNDLARRAMRFAVELDISHSAIQNAIEAHHLRHTVRAVEELYRGMLLEEDALNLADCRLNQV